MIRLGCDIRTLNIIAVALAESTRNALERWIQAESLKNAELMTYWATEIQETNDAKLAVREAHTWE